MSCLCPEGAFFSSYGIQEILHIYPSIYFRSRTYITNFCADLQVLWVLFQTSRLDSPQLEATFDTMIQVFLFLDKNGDGKLNKSDMVTALDDASPGEKSPLHITQSRFSIDCFTGYWPLFVSFFSVPPLNFVFLLVIFFLDRCRRNGLGQEWQGQFQGVPLRFPQLGWH